METERQLRQDMADGTVYIGIDYASNKPEEDVSYFDNNKYNPSTIGGVDNQKLTQDDIDNMVNQSGDRGNDRKTFLF